LRSPVVCALLSSHHHQLREELGREVEARAQAGDGPQEEINALDVLQPSHEEEDLSGGQPQLGSRLLLIQGVKESRIHAAGNDGQPTRRDPIKPLNGIKFVGIGGDDQIRPVGDLLLHRAAPGRLPFASLTTNRILERTDSVKHEEKGDLPAFLQAQAHPPRKIVMGMKEVIIDSFSLPKGIYAYLKLVQAGDEGRWRQGSGRAGGQGDDPHPGSRLLDGWLAGRGEAGEAIHLEASPSQLPP
jgi:hypothetical protein